MKGQLWDIFVMILTLAFLIFIVNTAFGSIGEAVRIDATLNSEKITGIINILQSSPAQTVQVYFLPESECRLTIKKYYDLVIVNFTSTEIGVTHNAITEPLITGIVIDELTSECSVEEEKKIFFQRCSNSIRISEAEIACI